MAGDRGEGGDRGATLESLSRDNAVQATCLLLITVVIVGAGLFWLKAVMIPFVLAVFLALGLSPLVDLQMRWLLFPKALAVLTTLVVAVGLLLLTFAIVSTSVSELAANATVYQERLTELIEGLALLLPLERLGLTREEILAPLTRLPTGTVSGLLLSTTNALLDLLSQASLVSIFSIYLLIGFSGRGEAPSGFWGEAEARIKSYLVAKIAISAVTGLLVGLTLWLLGIELAIVFGLFAFLLNFIPTLGSIFATLLPLPIVLMSPTVPFGAAVAAIAIPGGIQLVVGNVIEPLVMGDSLDLHPVAILLSLMVWGALWGIVGMLLAAPITAVLKIVFERTEHARPLAGLLAGRLG